jgi:hypothetical protein
MSRAVASRRSASLTMAYRGSAGENRDSFSGRARGGTSAVEGLDAAGRESRARVVTGELTVTTIRGRAIPLLDAVGILVGIDAAELDRLPASGGRQRLLSEEAHLCILSM